MAYVKLKPVQQAALDLTLNRNKANVFASPGTGKTLMILSTLALRELAGDEVFPALIVAPLRVAQAVWDTEASRWDDFAHFKCSKVIGSASRRTKALAAEADIYITNFANVSWLRKKLGDKWPFRTVVVDESTKIRGHRCRINKLKDGRISLVKSGTLAAKELVATAPRTAYWYNLSGTPTPRSVGDLWSQQWPIDYGKALGKTYSEFTRVFFRPAFGSRPEYGKFDLLPGAEKNITDLIKDNTVVLDAYDWFDISRPIEVNIPVPLSGAVSAQYKKMHEESVLQLQEDMQIAAPATMAKIMKCRQIASGTILDEKKERHFIHADRLEALKELKESLDDTPLLVSYMFIHEKDAILEAFGDEAVALPSGAGQQEVEKRWNDGKIPMLLIHPASAGHGLNLQYGSNHLCVFTPDWDFELYAQVIERIGPTRQAQAGLDRPVYIHRFFSPGTWDEVILKNLTAKYSNSEKVKAALAVTRGERLIEDTE